MKKEKTEEKKNRISIFLDSGAFSAFTKGVEINLNEYIEFVKKNLDVIDVYANLDVIRDPVATLRNQEIMEAAGLHPLPVFHIGSDYSYLKHYLEKGYDYIGLGIAAQKDKKMLIDWLDECFSKYLCKKDGFPKVKVHGFGITRLGIMLRYPWYSVDSTSWVISSRMGSIYVPNFRGGKWVYNIDPLKVMVSSCSPKKEDDGQHFDTFSPLNQKIILDYVQMRGYRIGKSESRFEKQPYKLRDNERWWGDKKDDPRELEVTLEDGLSNNYHSRDQINIMYFLDLEKSVPEWGTWPFEPPLKRRRLF